MNKTKLQITANEVIRADHSQLQIFSLTYILKR